MGKIAWDCAYFISVSMVDPTVLVPSFMLGFVCLVVAFNVCISKPRGMHLI